MSNAPISTQLIEEKGLPNVIEKIGERGLQEETVKIRDRLIRIKLSTDSKQIRVEKSLIKLLKRTTPSEETKEGREKIEKRRKALVDFFENLETNEAIRLNKRLTNEDDALFKFFDYRLADNTIKVLFEILKQKSKLRDSYLEKLIKHIEKKSQNTHVLIVKNDVRLEMFTLEAIAAIVKNTFLLVESANREKKLMENNLAFIKRVVRWFLKTKIKERFLDSHAEELTFLIRAQQHYLVVLFITFWIQENRWSATDDRERTRQLLGEYSDMTEILINGWKMPKRRPLIVEYFKERLEYRKPYLKNLISNLQQEVEGLRKHWTTKFFNATDVIFNIIINLTQSTASLLALEGIETGTFLAAMNLNYPQAKHHFWKFFATAWRLNKRAPDISLIIWSIALANTGFDMLKFLNGFGEKILKPENFFPLLGRVIYAWSKNPKKPYLAFIPVLVKALFSIHKAFGVSVENFSKEGAAILAYLHANPERVEKVKEQLEDIENLKLIETLVEESRISFTYYRKIMVRVGYSENIWGMTEMSA